MPALPAMEGVLLPEEAIARVDIEPPRRQDLPPAVALELRKDETVRCGVCRQVEKVLGEGGQVDAALSRMEQLVADKPDSVTGEMLVLMEQARSARAAREVHGAAVSLKESMAASAEEMSLADGRMGKSDVSARRRRIAERWRRPFRSGGREDAGDTGFRRSMGGA